MVNLVFAFVFLPLLTRPAAPRLATWATNLSVETYRPHETLIITDFERILFPNSALLHIRADQLFTRSPDDSLSVVRRSATMSARTSTGLRPVSTRTTLSFA